ncbi:hypothetical protein [Syntrophus aciditrophicus]|nr:hypothetical protein [Syntrophus aciditrophicus]
MVVGSRGYSRHGGDCRGRGNFAAFSRAHPRGFRDPFAESV